jgi:hypothetical protein
MDTLEAKWRALIARASLDSAVFAGDEAFYCL